MFMARLHLILRAFVQVGYAMIEAFNEHRPYCLYRPRREQ
jgi:hypothetical protein